MVTTLGEISQESAKRFGDKTALIIEKKVSVIRKLTLWPAVLLMG